MNAFDDDWLPIDTAPKTSEIVDIWSETRGRLANYKRVSLGKGNVFYDPAECGVCGVRDATHWKPIPAPPRR